MSALDRAAVERFRRDVERLLSGLPHAPLALAVSGGPDSMAMLALAAAAFPGDVIAATVDHGLRAESAGEARMAGAHAATLDVPHAILTIAAPPSGSGNLQAWARRERYAALRHWAVAAGASALATAHHADDQAETFLMRATRGSGLSGLAGIRARQEQPDMPPLIRPLLDWRRSALREIVAASATPFVDDPGNVDPRFERARLRAALRDVPALDSAGIARSAAHLAGVEADLLAVARWLWRTRMIHGTPHAISIDMTDLPRAVRRIVARDAIAHVMALHGEPWDRAGNIEALLDALEAGKSATQALVMASAAGGVWHFRKAPARGTN